MNKKNSGSFRIRFREAVKNMQQERTADKHLKRIRFSSTSSDTLGSETREREGPSKKIRFSRNVTTASSSQKYSSSESEESEELPENFSEAESTDLCSNVSKII